MLGVEELVGPAWKRGEGTWAELGCCLCAGLIGFIFLEWSSPKHNGLELVEWSFESGAAFGGVECSQTAPSLGHHKPTSSL